MLTDTKDWSNEPVIYYQLTLIISTSFIPGLEETNNDIYRLHNETLSGLVSTADKLMMYSRIGPSWLEVCLRVPRWDH